MIQLRDTDNYKALILLREGDKNLDIASLFESAHAFDEQYTWAKKCAKIVYKCIINGKSRAKVSFKGAKDKSLNGAKIEIIANNILGTNANINGLDENGFVDIFINANTNIIKKDEDDAVNEIWDAIVHELGHGNIYWKRYNNDEEINDAPDDYKKWTTIILDNNITPYDSVYLFCYALYSTYYHEVQAFVSQTYSDVIKWMKRLYGNMENITKEQFIKALTNTNTYKTYKSNIDISEKLIQSKGLRNILSDKLGTYGLYYSPDKILAKSKRIREISEDTLKAAYNNAYQWFYKSFKD